MAAKRKSLKRLCEEFIAAADAVMDLDHLFWTIQSSRAQAISSGESNDADVETMRCARRYASWAKTLGRTLTAITDWRKRTGRINCHCLEALVTLRMNEHSKRWMDETNEIYKQLGIKEVVGELRLGE